MSEKNKFIEELKEHANSKEFLGRSFPYGVAVYDRVRHGLSIPEDLERELLAYAMHYIRNLEEEYVSLSAVCELLDLSVLDEIVTEWVEK